jgi:hypothetical protein
MDEVFVLVIKKARYARFTYLIHFTHAVDVRGELSKLP